MKHAMPTIFLLVPLLCVFSPAGSSAAISSKELAVPAPTDLSIITTPESAPAGGDHAGISVSAACPATGNASIDNMIQQFCTEQSIRFLANAKEFLKDAGTPTITCQWRLNITGSVTRPSPAVCSIRLGLDSYSGGAHGFQDTATFNFQADTGKALALEDVFQNTPAVLRIFSDLCRKNLPEQPALKELHDPDLLRAGTEPTRGNFENWQITRNGILLIFPPYQVAPYAAGTLTVEIPLSGLAPAVPKKDFWGQ